MAWAYLLRCGDGSLYGGSTVDLDHRMDQHASGHGSVYTSTRLPVELVWCQEYESVADAWRMERRLHGWNRAKREALIRGDFDALRRLSRSHPPPPTTP